MDIRPDLASFDAILREQGLAALVCMSPENFTYAAGVHISTVENMRPRQAFAIIRPGGQARLVICAIELSLAKASSWAKDIRTYVEFRDDPISILAEALVEGDLGSATIGMDLDYLPASSYDRLRSRLPGLKLVNTTELVAAARSLKTADEITLIEDTTRLTHQAIMDALQESRVGDTEGVIANRIAHRLIDAGASGLLHLHLASGERSPQIHNHPGDDRTQPGEILRLDVGGLFGAYCSDLARTFSTGSPTEEQRRTYRHLLEVHAAVIAAIRPGVMAEDLFFLCKAEFEKRNLPCTLPHIGHSFGIEAHETPMIRPGDKTPLKPGMILNIEPMTSDSQGSCYHTEDSVLVTAKGNRVLTLGLGPYEIPVIGTPVFHA
jgi:Xaa-Pro aminopeptidase